MSNIYAALEIGTTRTVLAVGEAETGGRLKVTSHASIPSSGIRKSQILNITQAATSIKSVLKEIEKHEADGGHSLTIGNAFLVVSGQHVKIDSYQGSTPVAGAKVRDDDLVEAMRSSRGWTLPKDRELLDIVDQTYTLDSLGGIASPKGMSGRILKLDTLHIHADLNRINDAKTAASEAHLEIREPLFAATCAADAVLTDHERRNGALVLDIGGGSTGYAAYADGYLMHAGVLGVGGDHVTNDIAHAFQTTQAQAEEMKIKDASALIRLQSEGDARVKVPGASALMESRSISRHALDTVVNARLREQFSIIRERLEELDLMHRLHTGIVITGGGAAMRGIDTLIQRELGMPVHVGIPIHVDGLAEERHPESFAAVAGALMYAHRNYEQKSLFQTIFGGLLK
ncbi:MAG: cell division protein FtsA [Kiritimatiellae bacterium]|nr:cell division protein FtsA [Kiritimatiellia bacterium]